MLDNQYVLLVVSACRTTGGTEYFVFLCCEYFLHVLLCVAKQDFQLRNSRGTRQVGFSLTKLLSSFARQLIQTDACVHLGTHMFCVNFPRLFGSRGFQP